MDHTASNIHTFEQVNWKSCPAMPLVFSMMIIDQWSMIMTVLVMILMTKMIITCWGFAAVQEGNDLPGGWGCY